MPVTTDAPVTATSAITAAAMATPAHAVSNYSVEQIGHLFVKQYYVTMHSDPANLHRFYKKGSNFTHGNECEQVNTLSGQTVRFSFSFLSFQKKKKKKKGE